MNSPGQTGSSSDVSPFFSAELQDCSSPPVNSVYLCKNIGISTDDVIAVDVHLNTDAPVFGAAFDLILDPSSVEIARRDDKSIDFLQPYSSETDSKIWKRLIVAQGEGALIIGASRGRELGPLTGEIPIVTLKFMRPRGKTPAAFSNNSIIDETGNPVPQIDAARWFGGHFTP